MNFRHGWMIKLSSKNLTYRTDPKKQPPLVMCPKGGFQL